HEIQVVPVAVVVIAGHVAGVAVQGLAGRVAEAIPDGLAAPIGVDGALDLIRRGGRAPEEAPGEAQEGAGPGSLSIMSRTRRPHVAHSGSADGHAGHDQKIPTGKVTCHQKNAPFYSAPSVNRGSSMGHCTTAPVLYPTRKP